MDPDPERLDEHVRPDPGRAALLTIDTQNDFTLPGAPAEVPGTQEAVPRMGRLVEAFRDREAPVVHVVRLYRADGSNVDRCRRGAVEAGETVVRPGTDGAELVDRLKPSPDVRLDAERLLAGELQPVGEREWLMYKPRWSAFFRTPLSAHLDDLGVTTVVICGCNFPNCPRTTAYGASQRDYRLVVVPDATSGTYERGLEELRGIGAAVMGTDGVTDWLARPEGTP
jgi:nicotinamidase-related amidase